VDSGVYFSHHILDTTTSPTTEHLRGL
jgi:hypothetical protein